jgi:hypothetical protein
MTMHATFLAQVATAGAAVGARGLTEEASKMAVQLRLREVYEQACADERLFMDLYLANTGNAELERDYLTAMAASDEAWAAYERACGGRAA